MAAGTLATWGGAIRGPSPNHSTKLRAVATPLPVLPAQCEERAVARAGRR